jgi:peptidoglycan/xylan/chitin deacetylase (PgdA/CDA1 family)
MQPRVRRAVRSTLRAVHAALLTKPLPDDLAIYFHELEPRHWAEFRDAIAALLAMGYRPVTPDGLIAPRSGGKRLFVSFDDNFRNWHRALPLLSELRLTVTFYVNTLPFRDAASAAEVGAYFDRLGMSRDRHTLRRAELAELHAGGHTIGCHSHSHYVLARLPRSAWAAEIEGSRRVLEDITGAAVEHFAWPYGMRRHFSAALRAYCREIGFKTIANAIPGCQQVAGADPMNIFRTDWRLGQPLAHNLTNLRVDGRAYAALLGRSAIG